MPPLIVLADANVLVKDVVSYAFFDLAKAEQIDLRWTPQIEVEYVRHRARLRAQASGHAVAFDDLVWAQKRLDTIKRYVVPGFQLPDWDDNGERLELLRGDRVFEPLLRLPDPDDVHVALAAADWARSTGRDVVLATDNLKDLPTKLLEPFGVVPLHPGDVLELVYQINPERVSSSLQKTVADFKNPAFSLADLLTSISSPQQFDNKKLAAALAVHWKLTLPQLSTKTHL
ncbi:MAG: PIN domain-containing protein [Burkholderiaceae bacterium]|nr:PIN domain-containing protein [Burkholderiaceae bacterium]